MIREEGGVGGRNAKIAFVAIYLTALVIASVALAAFPITGGLEPGGLEVTRTSAPLTRQMHNATPELALASSSWGDYYPTEAPYPQYWGRLAADGEYYGPGEYYDEFDPVQWLGDSRADEWAVKFDLGQPTAASALKFQFGDLHTPGNRVGLKRFAYDVEVERAIGNWTPVAEGELSRDPQDRAWMDEWLSGRAETTYPDGSYFYNGTRADNFSLPLPDPLGATVDWHRTVLVQPGNYRARTFDYLVADGSAKSVLVFDSEGEPSYEIWPGDDAVNLWNSTGRKPTDVALLPIWTPTFHGGYLISTDGGDSGDGELWLAPYGEHRLSAGRLISSGFGDILQVATYWDGSAAELDVYVLEHQSSGDYVIHQYDRGLGSYADPYSPSGSDRSKRLGYTPEAAAAGPNRVALLNGDSDAVVTYSSGLDQLPGRRLTTGSGYGSFESAADVASVDGNLLVSDPVGGKVVSYAFVDGGLVGEFSAEDAGGRGGPLAARPFLPESGYDQYPEAGIWIAGAGASSLYMHTGQGIRRLGAYRDWHEHPVSPEDPIQAYRVRIYNLTYEDHPLLGGDLPKREGGKVAWNRPALVESLYDWVYDSAASGLNLSIASPREGENVVARGEHAVLPIELDMDIPETKHYDRDNFNLTFDRVQFSIDHMENITLSGGDAIPGSDDIFVYAEDFQLHNFELRENLIGEQVISNHSITRDAAAYYEATVDFGDEGYVYEVLLYNWLGYQDTNPGNTLEIFIDGESYRLLDETYEWLYGYHQVQAGKIAIGPGVHTLKVLWRGGGGKVDHYLWKFKPQNLDYIYGGGLTSERHLLLEEGAGEGVTEHTYRVNFPASTVYRIDSPPHNWYTLDGDKWKVYLDGELVEMLDEGYSEGFEWDARDLGAVYIPRGWHDLRLEVEGGIVGTLPPLRAWYNTFKFPGTIVSEGYHTLTIHANDTVGHRDSDSHNFSVIVYPRLDIYSPLDQAGYNTDIRLDLYARDSNLASLSYSVNNGTWTEVGIGGGTYEISHEVTIPIGDLLENAWNKISVVAADDGGHETFGYRTFFLDFEPPEVSFPGMENNTHLPPSGLYNFSVEDETLQRAWYTINGRARTELEPGNTTVEIPRWDFDNGENVLELFGEDQVGNAASARLVLTKDDAAPIIEILAPEPDGEFFEVNGSADPIPLEARAFDFAVNGSSPEFVSLRQETVDGSLRLHDRGHITAYQEFVAADHCLSDIGLAAMGSGRLRVLVREDRLFGSDPISGGYIEVSDRNAFQWYRARMSDARLEPGRTYYLYVTTLTPYTSLYLGAGKEAYPGGRAVLGGIPRPDWDLAFETVSRGLLNGTEAEEMWYAVNGAGAGGALAGGSISVANLTESADFGHGFNTISVGASDALGNAGEISRRIRYIDTSVRTNISASLISPAGGEWLFKRITVRWETNMPDYNDRHTRENYTHDLYLENDNGTVYEAAAGLVDVTEASVDTASVGDGYYRLVLNSTDGESEHTAISGRIRVVNGEPRLTIEAPPELSYANGDRTVNISVICGNLDRTVISIDGGDNETLDPAAFDFETGYIYLYNFTASDKGDGVHYIDTYAMDSGRRVDEGHAVLILDREFEVSLTRLGTQAAEGTILFEWDMAEDARWVNLTLINSTSLLERVHFSGEDLPESYLLEAGLSAGTYRVTVTAGDRAGNVRSDSFSFLVDESALADFFRRFLGILEALVLFVSGAFGLGIVLVRDRRRRSPCPGDAECPL
jgi:hypothetical protein